MQNCNVESCHLKCDGRNCEQTCNNEHGTCNLTCNKGKCSQTCNKGTCDLKCNGRHCRQMCNEGACGLECNGQECDQTCFRECNLKCHGKSCEQRCSELKVPGSCQVHCPLAGRSNKCQQSCESKESQCTKHFITITEAPTWTGEGSNEFAIALTGSALSRGEGRRREAPSSFPSIFAPHPYFRRFYRLFRSKC